MGVLAKKKIYPSNEEDLQQQQINEQQNRSTNGQQRTSRINSQLHLNRNILKQQESQDDFNQRNRTFIIRKAFQTGLNQLSNTIKKPVNRKLTKLDSNNVELIQSKFRKNGWSPPVHPLQIAAAFVFLLMICLLFIYFLPQIDLENKNLIYLIYVICILITIVHIILHLLAMSINPADDNVIAKQRKQPNKSVPNFDRNKHKHVIENQFLPVSAKSKHCSRCNVCIQNFDHHCNWLNSCIGSKNYKLFISSVISALIGSLIIYGLSIIFLICYGKSNCVWLDNQYLNGLEYDDQTFDNQTNIDTNLTTTKFNQTNETLSIILNTPTSLDLSNNFTIDNEFTNENFTDSLNNTNYGDENDDSNSLQYQTIIHLSIIIMSLILSSITIILLLHLLCFHLFLNCIGLSTYEFIVQRREAAQKNVNQENTEQQPTINERILRCLSCQSDWCSNLLPKTQTELATSQSIIEKNTNQTNLIKKRQLSRSESNQSRNSRESGHYSSRTVSLYEDFTTGNDKNITDLNTTSKIINQQDSENTFVQNNGIYIGSPQRRLMELEEWRALNNKNIDQ